MFITGVREGQEEPTSTHVLLALNRIETQLSLLVGPKGRLSNIECDLEDHKKLLDDHERKIQRAHGALGVLILLWGGLEAYFHKVLGK